MSATRDAVRLLAGLGDCLGLTFDLRGYGLVRPCDCGPDLRRAGTIGLVDDASGELAGAEQWDIFAERAVPVPSTAGVFEETQRLALAERDRVVAMTTVMLQDLGRSPHSVEESRLELMYPTAALRTVGDAVRSLVRDIEAGLGIVDGEPDESTPYMKQLDRLTKAFERIRSHAREGSHTPEMVQLLDHCLEQYGPIRDAITVYLVTTPRRS